MEKRYEASRMEKEMQKLWEQCQIYAYDPHSTKEIFSIDTPPPTVSGHLHIGHIFSYTQAEMIARFKRMQGYNVFYPFGFDDNGLPTERLVEKEKGIRAKDLPRSNFTKICRETATHYEDAFKSLWQSLGFSVDWDLQYETSSEQSTRISQRLFLELVRKGKAYMKESPVLWCTECQTSIAQAELETIEKETTFNTIPFQVGEETLWVATTRPELLYGCVCLFIHPDDKRFNGFIGKEAKVPIYDYDIPILADEAVSMEKGTGIVMCATFGDTTDMQWFETHQLPYRKVILADGTIEETIPYIGGLKVEAARAIILQELQAKGLLLKQETITHTVAIHERCQKPIEILPSKQWYIDLMTDKEKYLQAADEIRWYPAYMKNRYLDWVKNLKWDWCISRQRYHGVAIPLWYCKTCGKMMLPSEDELPLNPMETSPKEHCECGGGDFIPETAVLDTWATSSISPQINQKTQEIDERKELKIPMGLRTQAHEIIRTWAFYTIARSLYHTEKLPWKDIMISGFILAKKGEKISKSKNNGKLEPKMLIENHSADALRYWAANAKLGTDTFFSEEELISSKRFMTKLWNASKFAIMHLQDLDKIWILKDAQEIKLLPADAWILERLDETMQKATKYLNDYEVGLAKHEIDECFWKDFCDDYLEIVKDRLYKPEIHGEAARQSGQYALYHGLLKLLKLYAIYIPHETETIYQSFFKQYETEQSIHLMEWDKERELDTQILGFGKELQRIIGEVRKYKSENNLSMRAELEVLEVQVEQEMMPYFEQEELDLKACCNANAIQFDKKDKVK